MLDCTKCTKKHNTASAGHCTEFQMKPQIDDCALHSDTVAASATPVSENGHYIGLDRDKEPAPTTPQ